MLRYFLVIFSVFVMFISVLIDRLASSWALYVSQEAIVQCARRHDVEVTFFHGKGGTVGRGGNPALYQSILAHPPDTIKGRFRVTEQVQSDSDIYLVYGVNVNNFLIILISG